MNKPQKIAPFKHFCLSIGVIPSAYTDAMTYYELLEWLCQFLQNNVIPTVNNNSEVVTELQNYVTHYFDNLDVQEEINNKLDEMVEEGTLQEIISLYLNSVAFIGFNNVAEMKESTILKDGSYAETIGFYEANDGGGAKYKIRNITNEDVVDNMLLIPIGEELVAELLVIDELNILSIGAKNNNSTDNHDVLQKALSTNYNVFIPKGNYVCNGNISCTVAKKIHGNGKIIFTNTTDDGLTIGDGVELCEVELNTGANFTGTVLTYDGSLGTRTYPSTTKIHDIVVSTNATSNIECLFDFRPDRNYGIVLNNIKLGGVFDSRKADYGFKALETQWVNSITINSMNIDIYGQYPLYIYNNSGVGGSGKNWTLNAVTVQVRQQTYYAGFYFKNMLNLTLNSCYLWDPSDGTFPNGKIIFEGCRYIETNGCSEDFYTPVIISPVAYLEAYTGYTTETDNYHRTPMMKSYSGHGTNTNMYPLFFPAFNFIETINDIELFSRYAYNKQDGIYFKLQTRGLTQYNAYYARDIVLHANLYHTLPVIYKIQQVLEGTIVWVKGNSDIFVRCSCAEKPYWADNKVVTEISTGNSITLAPIEIGENEPLPQTGTIKYFYNQTTITTFD